MDSSVHNFIVTPFSSACLSSLRKEGKIRVLDFLHARYCRSHCYACAHFVPRSQDFVRPKIRVLDFDASEKRGFPSLGHWVCFAHTACPHKIRLLDYWLFKSFCTPFRFVYTNLTSPNFFTGRAGFDLMVSLGALAKIRKKKL